MERPERRKDRYRDGWREETETVDRQEEVGYRQKRRDEIIPVKWGGKGVSVTVVILLVSMYY